MPKAAVLVDGLNPLFQSAVLGITLLVRLPLGFQNQHVPGFQANDEVRALLPHHAPIDVEHLEAQMVVLDPGLDQRIVVQLEGL